MKSQLNLINNEITLHIHHQIWFWIFSFSRLGTPINRLPIMAKSVLDLYELYNLVVARGGLVDVINKKLWQEIIKGLHLPSSITSAAFTLRTQWVWKLKLPIVEKRNRIVWHEIHAIFDLMISYIFTKSYWVSRTLLTYCSWIRGGLWNILKS